MTAKSNEEIAPQTLVDSRRHHSNLQAHFGIAETRTDSGTIISGGECPKCEGVLLLQHNLAKCQTCDKEVPLAVFSE